MVGVTDILKGLEGRLVVSISLDKKPFIDIHIKKMNIVIDVKNPVLAIQFGMKKLFEPEKDERILRLLRKKGYKIKIMYRKFELDLV